MTIDEAQERISSEQFTEMTAYLSIEPRGYEMENWRMGVVAATVANVTLRPRKPFKPQDFYPDSPRKSRNRFARLIERKRTRQAERQKAQQAASTPTIVLP